METIQYVKRLLKRYRIGFVVVCVPVIVAGLFTMLKSPEETLGDKGKGESENVSMRSVYNEENSSWGKTGMGEERSTETDASESAEGQGTEPSEEAITEEASSLWMLPPETDCLFTEDEKSELKEQALTAARKAAAVYQNADVEAGPAWASNIRNFTEEQCREVVMQLGSAGYVSVSEHVNMENNHALEDFYTAYQKKEEAMVTVFQVNGDGFIGAFTFLYRDGKIQTCHVGIGWKAGGIPEVKSVEVSNISEIKLTEKGYFIYMYETAVAHSELRQYWRTQPLSDTCRKLTEKYLQGLSYVNYNVLITNWNSSNVEDILIPCMFEDIYRIATGENLHAENGRIPSDVYEGIMTVCFPVSVEQVRKHCGYDVGTDSYPYEMIFSRQYPPFGEVTDYRENQDGTITLYVDGVWPDYNSDCAFTNEIVIQPFEDGSFRYLSNTIEKKEMELPVPVNQEN